MRHDIAIGDRFGRWLVIGERGAGGDIGGVPHGLHCRCECGRVSRVNVTSLVRGATRGCLECRIKDSAPRPRSTRVANVGAAYGRYIIVRELDQSERSGDGREVIARCGCGSEKRVLLSNLTRGLVLQCQRCAWGECGTVTHGRSGSWIHSVYRGMVGRCTNECDESYSNYGGRGIRVHPSWLGPEGIERWYAYMGDRPSDRHSIDRVNNNGNYEPGNVRWATQSEQMRNTRLSRPLRVSGEVLTMDEAGARLGISRQAIAKRIAWGWSEAEAATTPKGELPERVRAARVAKRGRRVGWRGETMTLSGWSRRTGLSDDTLMDRLHAGWPLDLVFTAPKGTPINAHRSAA